MIAKSYILKNLQWLDKQYNSAKSQRASLLYSKLALLELCGWIEESMDDVVNRCVNKNVKKHQYRQYLKEQVVERNSGFDYERHFRSMLVQIVGFSVFEKLEKRVDPVKLHLFKSSLGSLKTIRNSAAHTHIKGITPNVKAPSWCQGELYKIYDGLITFDQTLRLLKK
ncbi:MAG: hypothetical protein HND56_07115 [Pseudomonadota bacterium]|nr:hypothetical protein [Pseudomonadota bacterium]QKK05466.1 MAG: hypothetical protein HND56_07115 [Pseudomonadota bacterium]